MITTHFFSALTGQFPIHRHSPRPSVMARLRAHGRARRQYQHLEDLPDYLLEDIGLTRGDVGRARRQNRFF